MVLHYLVFYKFVLFYILCGILCECMRSGGCVSGLPVGCISGLPVCCFSGLPACCVSCLPVCVSLVLSDPQAWI